MKNYRIGMAIVSVALFLLELCIEHFFEGGGFVRGYLGDFFVVILLYTIIQAVRPLPPIPVGIAIALFAGGVEIVQLFDPAERMGFGPGTAVHTLLGSTFSAVDLVMYFAGVTAIAAADLIVRTKSANHVR